MALTQRMVEILKAIVDEFVATAEPVGSKTLVGKYDLPYSRCFSLATCISFLIESIFRFIRMLIVSKIIKWASKY